ncbi:hypothetical protein [Halococcus sp. AFM35]|uniref:hypothetical protein n=1 Tax=Halococcus sp. AFM35 TaxID=3421653 RepID=UPI003EBFF6CB
MRPRPHLVLLFASVAVYVGRGGLLGEWAVHPGFLVAFVVLSVGVYALRDDYYPIHE